MGGYVSGPNVRNRHRVLSLTQMSVHACFGVIVTTCHLVITYLRVHLIIYVPFFNNFFPKGACRMRDMIEGSEQSLLKAKKLLQCQGAFSPLPS